VRSTARGGGGRTGAGQYVVVPSGGEKRTTGMMRAVIFHAGYFGGRLCRSPHGSVWWDCFH
jgi:hypothetical protein